MFQLSPRKRQWLLAGLKALSYLFFAVALLVVGGYLWESRSTLEPIRTVPAFLWLIPTIFYIGTLIAKGLSFDALARVYNVRVRLLDSVGLTASGLLSNYAVPGNVSIPLRTIYMHKVLGLHYKDFLPIAIAAFAFSTGLYGIFVGIAALILAEIPSHAYALIVVALSGGGLALILAMSLSSIIPYDTPLIGRSTNKFFSGWRRLCRSKRHFAHWLIIIFVLALVEIGFFYSIIRILGIDLTVAQTAIIVLTKENSAFLRITPGAFGVTEGVQVFIAAQFGLDAAPILLAAVIARAIELLILTSISFILAGRLTNRLANPPAYSVRARYDQ